MRTSKILSISAGLLVTAAACALFATGCSGCNSKPAANAGPISMTGIKEAVAEVKAGTDGLTNEQRNIKERLKLDNDPGSIKHLYVFSSMTGKPLLYSTVRGKVTSSGKRLSPTTLQDSWPNGNAGYVVAPGSVVNTPGGKRYTAEAIQDDGTYGSSIDYLYWFDVKGTFRQLYVPSGAMLVISTEPLPIPENEIQVHFSTK
jgi:hypothetical protein